MAEAIFDNDAVTANKTFLDRTKTYHGVVIMTDTQQPIGRIQSYNPKFASRTLSPIYELNWATFGRPIDYVPSKEEGRGITCNRVEVWNEEFEIAFGGSLAPSQEWIDLCDQNRPFTLHEKWYKGTDDYRMWVYKGVWIASKDLDELSADGEATVKANVEMNYVIRQIVA